MTLRVAAKGAGLHGVMRWLRANRARLMVVLAVALACAGFAAMHMVLRDVHLRDVRAAVADTAPWRIVAALGLTAASYLALTGYDAIGLRAIGKPQPWRVAALASFTSYTLSNNLGLALITGGSARYRAYRAVGLSLADVVRVGALASAAFWGGVLGLAAVALIAAPAEVTLGSLHLGVSAAHASGLLVLLALAAVPAARALGWRGVRVGIAAMPAPGLAGIGALAAVSLIDLATAAAALAILVPGIGMGDMPVLVLAYALALLAGVVTHVPGGIGVFEAVMLTALPGDRPALFAALLLYRLIYYLLPLLIAGVLVVGIEGARLRRPIGTGLSLLDRAARALSPTLVTVLVFAGGLVLLVSGALPGARDRLGSLDVLPLPLVEGSHLAGSLAGVALLLVAPALNARLANGFHVARALLLGGAVFSLLKGLDYEEAGILLIVLLLLQYSRRAFYRQGGVLAEPLDWAWIGAGVAALGLSLWAGFFAYKRTPYSADLWWQFALNGNAPRFLRASFAAGVMMTAAVGWRLLLRRREPPPGQPLEEEVAARALAASPRSDANLAFTGAKRFTVSQDGDAFLMYGIQNRTWIVMGDPVGPRARWSELVWATRRACDAVGGRLCFFQASEAMLPLFVDLGLRAYKYGEEAQIPLAHFSLAGPKAKALRYGRKRALAAGLSFAILSRDEVPAVLPQLRQVSDEWLATRGAREKGFSLGVFAEAYMTRFDVAVVRDGAAVVAFANIWSSGDGRELSVDLMRHRSGMPYGAMDYLFVELLEWGQRVGFDHFNLGVAPLSGINGDRLAPTWAKLARTLFENGERFYHFAGLRAFKSKFDPVWRSRYIGAPNGLAAGAALIDLVAAVNAPG
ncbi:phosphatidylglycerol lysyltransferase [Sphingomonas gellani]|uniref:Phosphatidylglycerol lysyltransferase n=1 Tax=Sphingomonas gellani TaxID=1166340 RepID=A0A1H8GMF2_9SPHN|nr:bifunctional lysylphosphatidylglycerol flippase/synthetase MprF [Sphingomonas gellani]SEN44478.1 phosphatidylglycerol lysyltransferase [Sphingomonas gellani]